MVSRLGTGRGDYGSAADNFVYCGTGHDHLRAMGLKLIISVKTTGCAVTLDAWSLHGLSGYFIVIL